MHERVKVIYQAMLSGRLTPDTDVAKMFLRWLISENKAKQDYLKARKAKQWIQK